MLAHTQRLFLINFCCGQETNDSFIRTNDRFQSKKMLIERFNFSPAVVGEKQRQPIRSDVGLVCVCVAFLCSFNVFAWKTGGDLAWWFVDVWSPLGLRGCRFCDFGSVESCGGGS